ncbi:mechanosensitive ion channel family protein [Marinobacter sp. 71-i]|uniref:Mechanosensitive ion channel family protein n=1 Tax=Marinobacter iranensis TaxID=2962607 RepID=A0ABT5YAW3_9GAMM|nr:mechanosensitive ion channel domain-containing protein [Marinobacter iranensis]MDF0750747.1 mechanosensitive ion channel family protein [Marinobacter iranensis]
MLESLAWVPENFSLPDSMLRLVVSTVLLVLAIVILRTLTARFIRRNIASSELRGRLLVNSRNGFLLLGILGLALIWGDQIRSLALSIVAIAVAFVVATKELILCVSGSILKSGAGSFNLGDRIQVKDFRGDVIDQTLLATTILEVGPGKTGHQRTGRMIVIPNALFVAEPVINESFTDHWDFHVFTVPFKREDDWQAAQKALLEAANRHCEPYLEQVRKHMNKVGVLRGLEVPSVDPRVTIQAPVANEIHLTVRLPAKSGRRSYIEQSILSEVFASADFSSKKPRPADEEKEDNE